MRRTTVKIPDEVDDRLRKLAELTGTSVSELVRRAIEGFLDLESRHPRRLSFTGIGNSGYTHTSERTEDILREIFEERPGRHHPRQ